MATPSVCDPSQFFFFCFVMTVLQESDFVRSCQFFNCPFKKKNVSSFFFSFLYRISTGSHVQHSFTTWPEIKKGPYLETGLVLRRTSRHSLDLSKEKVSRREPGTAFHWHADPLMNRALFSIPNDGLYSGDLFHSFPLLLLSAAGCLHYAVKQAIKESLNMVWIWNTLSKNTKRSDEGTLSNVFTLLS